VRRHRRRRARLDVRVAREGVRARRDEPGVHAPLQPVGAARDRRAPERGSRPWTVGGAGPRADGRDGPDLPRGRGRPGGRRVTRRLALVGLGPGDPELVTAEAARVLNEVDYFLVADKTASHPGTADLIAMREAICER